MGDAGIVSEVNNEGDNTDTPDEVLELLISRERYVALIRVEGTW